jgi:hypothetical protein
MLLPTCLSDLRMLQSLSGGTYAMRYWRTEKRRARCRPTCSSNPPPPFRKRSGSVTAPSSPSEAAHFAPGKLALCGVGANDHERREWPSGVAVSELRIGEVGNVDEPLEAG